MIRPSFLIHSILFSFTVSCTTVSEKASSGVPVNLDLVRGDIALCGASDGQFGTVGFKLQCSEKITPTFNLATALLHSFEYAEAEKVFAKVVDEDPSCVMGYWGLAMSNFHPLWAPPTKEELAKGAAIVSHARTLADGSSRAHDYLETVATLYDNHETIDHTSRLIRFENASAVLYQKYPSDQEAAIFYALALRAAADPADKEFAKQRKAGELLKELFRTKPDHPGVAHYLIHIYDYPELAELALPAARKYAGIASASAHALHMPSHIFTRLGLWDESITSNSNSIAAAKCYAANSGMTGHWDEEIHGIDYLAYAYLQQGKDKLTKDQVEYLSAIDSVFPMTSKVGYTLAAVPARYALERKNWREASSLEWHPEIDWKKFPWERSNILFARLLGAVHLGKLDQANSELQMLKQNHEELLAKGKKYEANQILIQLHASEGWISHAKGDNDTAIRLVTLAADMEDATEKHPVTPGEIVPARELLGDLFMELKDYKQALIAYEEDLRRHQGRYNALQGASRAAMLSGDKEKAQRYSKAFATLAKSSERMGQGIIEPENNRIIEQRIIE